MSALASIPEVFDVFLCHNSEDKPAVRELAQRLRERGLRPWLDERELRPGQPWSLLRRSSHRPFRTLTYYLNHNHRDVKARLL